MATSESTTKFKADISQLKAQMQAAARQVKLANSEFKAATAGMKDWKSSADGLEAKLKQLNTVLTAQKSQLSILESELKKTVEEYGENSSAADNLKIRINNQKAAIANTEAQLEDYNQELKDCQDGTGKFADELEDADDSIEDTTEATEKMSDGFTVAKGVMANLIAEGIKACVSALKDLAEGAYEAYEAFKEGQDEIIKKTGATGEALDELKENYVNVMQTVITESSTAGEAIGEVSTKFGLSGEALEELTTKFIKFAELNNTDVVSSIDSVQSACAAWNIESENAGDLLDLLNATNQKTGASVDSLSSSLTSNAAALKGMGLNVDEAVTFLGKLEVSGVDSSTVLAGLKKALANASKEGKTTSEALAELQEAMESSDTTAEATVAAMELFGSKAGPAIAEACQSGRLSFNDLGEAMTGYQGNVDDTYEATQDGADKIKLAWQGMKTEVGALVGSILDDYAPDIEDVMDDVKDGLKTILETVKSNAPQIKEKISTVIEFAKNGITWLIENFDDISETLKLIGTILITTFAVSKVVAFIEVIQTMISTMAALKAATEAAEAAQLLLNVAQMATPIGLVTAAVAALAAGIVYLATRTEEYKTIEADLSEELLAEFDRIDELNNKYRELADTRTETVSGIVEEYGYYEQLADELELLVDENGKVKDGYEDRANFIVTTLNDACGTEIELLDGIITDYNTMKDSIYEVIQAQKARAVLTANEELYTEAIKNQRQAVQDYVSTTNTYNEKVAEMEEKQKAYNEAMNMTANEYAELNGLIPDMSYNTEALAEYQGELAEELLSAKLAVTESRTAMNDATDTYEGYMSTIQNYEGLSSAIISGDAEKISESLDNMIYDFKTAETATKDTLEQQVEDYETNYEALRTAIQNGTPGVTQDMVDQAKSMVDKAKAELDKAPDQFATSANAGAAAYYNTFGSDANKASVFSTAGELRAAANEGLWPNGGEKDAADNFTQGYIDAMTGKYGAVSEASKTMGGKAVDGLNEGQESHSPSAKTYTSGENFSQGFINGMDSKSSAIWQKAYSLAQKALSALKAGQKEGSPSKLTRQSGSFFGEGYELGIADTVKDVVTAATNLALSAVAGLDDTDSKKSGVDLVAGFIEGIESMSGDAEDAVSGLGKGSFVNGMKSIVSNAKTEVSNALSGSGMSVISEVKNTTGIASGVVGYSGGAVYTSAPTNVTNNYNLSQTNNSPKSLSALETYQARRQQIVQLKGMMALSK